MFVSPAIEVRAATLTWTGAAGDGNINTAGNWSPAQAPVSGDTLIYAGGTSLTPQLATSLSVTAITFNNTAEAFILGGSGVYTIGSGGLTNSSTFIQTINNAITLSAAQTWNASSGDLILGGNIVNSGFLLTINGGNDITINGIISGTGGLTKNSKSTGSLILNGANTYTGSTTLSGANGTVAIGNNLAFGTSVVTFGGSQIETRGGDRTISNAISVTSNTTFTNANDLTLSGTITMTGARTFTTSGAGSVIFDGIVSQSSGNRKLTKAGSGTLALNGANTYSGGLTVTGGTIVLGNNAAGGTGTISIAGATVLAGGAARTLTNAVTLAGDATFSGGYDLTFTGATAVAAVRTLTVSNSTTFSGVLSGIGGLTKNGAGVLVLGGTGANTLSGAMAVSEGTLVFNKTAGVNAFGGTSLTIGDGTGIVNSAVVQLNASSQIPSAAAVMINADGQLNLQGFTANAATLTMAGGSVTGTGSARLDLGGNLTVTTAGSNVAMISANLGLVANRTFTVNDNAVPTDNDLVISGIISTGFSLTKAGAGTLLLSGVNTFSGGANIIAGRLMIDQSAAQGVGAVNLGDTTGSSAASLLFSATSGRVVSNAITVSSGSSGGITLGGLIKAVILKGT